MSGMKHPEVIAVVSNPEKERVELVHEHGARLFLSYEKWQDFLSSVAPKEPLTEDRLRDALVSSIKDQLGEDWSLQPGPFPNRVVFLYDRQGIGEDFRVVVMMVHGFTPRKGLLRARVTVWVGDKHLVSYVFHSAEPELFAESLIELLSTHANKLATNADIFSFCLESWPPDV